MGKALYQGKFLYSGEVTVLHTRAATERQAKTFMVHKLAAMKGLRITRLLLEFNGSQDNFEIIKKSEKGGNVK